jgi:hypothetical protein
MNLIKALIVAILVLVSAFGYVEAQKDRTDQKSDIKKVPKKGKDRKKKEEKNQ